MSWSHYPIISFPSMCASQTCVLLRFSNPTKHDSLKFFHISILYWWRPLESHGGNYTPALVKMKWSALNGISALSFENKFCITLSIKLSLDKIELTIVNKQGPGCDCWNCVRGVKKVNNPGC